MINIHNIYYMLAYAFQVLKEKEYSNIETEEFTNIQNLIASILSKGLLNQVKRGLGKEYISNSEALTSPKGKFDISKTINDQTLMEKKIYCTYDVFSENTQMNKILKSSAVTLLKSSEVDSDIKKLLKRNLLYLSNVEEVNLNRINWSLLRYNRNNANYKMLMNICYLLSKGLIQSDRKGDARLASFIDDQHMHKLYEKFILEYYKKHYPHLKASASYISWDTDDDYIECLPKMQSDITLEYNGQYLVIDAKYYGKSIQNGLYNKKTIRSNNLYQIFSYVKNKDTKHDGSVNGMLLYAKTDELLIPDFEYKISGNKIVVKTLDLDVPFNKVSKQLDAIVSDWMQDINKRVS